MIFFYNPNMQLRCVPLVVGAVDGDVCFLTASRITSLAASPLYAMAAICEYPQSLHSDSMALKLSLLSRYSEPTLGATESTGVQAYEGIGAISVLEGGFGCQ